jgi:hypothetical protein
MELTKLWLVINMKCITRKKNQMEIKSNMVCECKHEKAGIGILNLPCLLSDKKTRSEPVFFFG